MDLDVDDLVRAGDILAELLDDALYRVQHGSPYTTTQRNAIRVGLRAWARIAASVTDGT